MASRELSDTLYRIGAVRFGSFTLKDGRQSPFYFDLRILVSHPVVLARVARAMALLAAGIPYDRIAGIPYAGLPIAVAMSLVSEKPMLYPRKEAKQHGTKKAIEGEMAAGETALVVDDVVTSGGAKIEAIGVLRDAGLVVQDVVVVVDRTGGDAPALRDAGVNVHSVLGVRELFACLHAGARISDEELQGALAFLEGA